jgi:tetratricopeptide (TPR) repeat protein
MRINVTPLIFTVALFVFITAAAFCAKAQADLQNISLHTSGEPFEKAVSFLLDSQWDEAITQFKNAQNYYIETKNYRQIVACYLGITNCYFFKGDYFSAMEFCNLALELHIREIKDDQEGLDTLTITQSLCKAALNKVKTGELKTQTSN